MRYLGRGSGALALAPGCTLILACSLAFGCTAVVSPGIAPDAPDHATWDVPVEAEQAEPARDVAEAVDPIGEQGPDVAPEDAPPPLKGSWEPCGSNAECESGFCAADQGRKVCTEVCVETCPDGWTCEPVLIPGGESVWACASRFWALCRPCVDDADCREGVLSGTCVTYGPDGRFCGAACGAMASGAPCPAGYDCSAAGQCVATSRACECTPLYAKEGFAAGCEQTSAAGTCPGTRVCGADGVLGPCDAPEPALETCNGKDDDCDGKVDEGVPSCCACGDGKCQTFCEDAVTCCADCHECGNGKCECGESYVTCAADCCGTCGDGKCARYEKDGAVFCTESEESCPADCHPAACGDGKCEGTESPDQCPADCKKGECGNHVCESTDGGPSGCPEDCAATCGNCWCEGTESSADCPGDCGTCGDGYCSACPSLGPETHDTCWKDCCVPSPEGETCGNHADDDCDGEEDEDGALGCVDRWRDNDADGWGWTPDARCLCAPGVPYTATKPGDCNDADAGVNPAKTEACNGKDDDCNGATDGEGSAGCTEWWRDEDGDGYGVDGDSRCLCAAAPPYVATKPGDCLDNDPTVNPAGTEICNGKDDDCSGGADPEGAFGCTSWYRDDDGDHYGLADDVRCLCGAVAPYDTQVAGDCDDGDPNVHPNAPETCNGKDDDCNGTPDDAFPDADKDGWGDPCDTCPLDAGLGYAVGLDGTGPTAATGWTAGVVNTFTIEMWVRPTATHEIDSESSVGTAGVGGQRYAVFPQHGEAWDAGGVHAGLGVSVGTNGVSVYEHKANGMPALLVWAGALPRWTHVAVVVAPGPAGRARPRLLVNGQSVQTGLESATADVHPSVTGLGGDSYGKFKGELDDVRFWSVARSDAEVRADLDRRLTGAEPGLLAYYPMDEGAGSVLHDLAPGRHDATFGDPGPAWVGACLPRLDSDGDGTPDARDEDRDGDGDPNGSDCAPDDPTIGHGRVETCNGIDDDCDGTTDPEDASGCGRWYRDADGDGFGVSLDWKCLCAAAGQYRSQQPGDCDDANAAVRPGASEVCNGKDDDCDGAVDNGSLCDDGIPCTSNQCMGAAGCGYPVQPGRCLIDGACFADGQPRPGSACQVCASSKSKTAWSALADGSVSEVAYWWRKDACGRFHAAWVSAGNCYVASTTTPFGTWGTPVLVGTCDAISIEVDGGPTCAVHLAYNQSQGGNLQYAQWNGSVLAESFTVAASAWGCGLRLDSQDLPHVHWSNSRAYHRSRAANGSWNATTEISAGAPSGWNPSIVLGSDGTWRGTFRRGSPPPSSTAWTYESYSTDGGQTWQGATQLFQDFAAGGWYSWMGATFTTQKSSRRGMLFQSNKSGSDDLWYTENSGAAWVTPALWRPIGSAIKTELRAAATEPSSGNPAWMGLSRADDATKWYHQFKCFGKAATAAVAWPSKGAAPVAAMMTWEEACGPRVFWRESAAASTWFTTLVPSPGCN